MGVRLGMEGKLYKNDGTYAVPVWTELPNVKDVTLNLETGATSTATRTFPRGRASVFRDRSVFS